MNESAAIRRTAVPGTGCRRSLAAWWERMSWWRVEGPSRSIWTTGATRSGQTPSNAYPVTTRSHTDDRIFPSTDNTVLAVRNGPRLYYYYYRRPHTAQEHGDRRIVFFSRGPYTSPPPIKVFLPKPTHKRCFRGFHESGARGARRSIRLNSPYRYTAPIYYSDL